MLFSCTVLYCTVLCCTLLLLSFSILCAYVMCVFCVYCVYVVCVLCAVGTYYVCSVYFPSAEYTFLSLCAVCLCVVHKINYLTAELKRYHIYTTLVPAYHTTRSLKLHVPPFVPPHVRTQFLYVLTSVLSPVPLPTYPLSAHLPPFPPTNHTQPSQQLD